MILTPHFMTATAADTAAGITALFYAFRTPPNVSRDAADKVETTSEFARQALLAINRKVVVSTLDTQTPKPGFIIRYKSAAQATAAEVKATQTVAAPANTARAAATALDWGGFFKGFTMDLSSLGGKIALGAILLGGVILFRELSRK